MIQFNYISLFQNLYLLLKFGSYDGFLFVGGAVVVGLLVAGVFGLSVLPPVIWLFFGGD
jgi:hypothetical protein